MSNLLRAVYLTAVIRVYGGRRAYYIAAADSAYYGRHTTGFISVFKEFKEIFIGVKGVKELWS
ncbi:MAG: hypothetical protein HG458_007535 [Prevotella sp.]|nr:hypothetical protein [Prevotella sp.]